MDERALRDANVALERAEAILNSASDAVILASTDGRISQTNPAFDAMFGYRVDEMYGQSLTALATPSSILDVKAALDNLNNTAQEQRLEVNVKRSNGDVFVVDMAIALIPSKSHHDMGFVCSIRDMTYRKQIEDALQTTAARLQRLIGNLQDGILLESPDRHVQLVNDAFLQMFNIPLASDAIVGADCVQMLEDSRPSLLRPDEAIDRVEKVLAAQQLVTHDVLELVDGRILERDYVPIFVEDRYAGHLWQYRDVTERLRSLRRAEQLQRIEKLHAAIIAQFLQMDDVDHAMNTSLAMVGQILDVSRVYVFHFRVNERLLDNTHEWCAPNIHPEIDNLKGLWFDDLVPSFFPTLANEGLIQAYDITTLADDVLAVLEPQGIKSVLIVPLVVEERIEGFLGFDENRVYRTWQPEDFTILRSLAESYARALERQSAEHALIRLRDDALRAARLRSQFVSNTSHEIRTPMTGILGMLDLLMETELDPDQYEFAKTAHDSAYHLLDIINSVLDFSKIDAGEITLESESFNVVDLLRDVQSTLSVLAKHNNVDLRLDIEANVPMWLVGDVMRLRQVLTNLVGNAVKFTHDGYVTIRLLVLGAAASQVRLRFEVVDSGIGIAYEHQQTIFESFVQADGSMVRKYGGTGLGLPIAKQLVELMGGEIELQSEPGKGSTFGFSLTMPFVPVKTEELLDQRLSERWQALVIDDDDTARYVLSQQLVSLGITVRQAKTLSELPIELMRSSNENCVVFYRFADALSDVDFQTLTELKQKYQCLLTAVVSADDTVDVDRRLFDGTLLRPAQKSSIQALLLNAENMVAILDEQPTPPPSPKAFEPSYCVLLAEDRPDNQNLVWRILRELDIQLDIATNGEEAIELLQQRSYDLMLMDIQMPVMNGIEALEHIRNILQMRELPIIAVTASVLITEIEQYLTIGFDAVLSKPFSVKGMRDVVSKYLHLN